MKNIRMIINNKNVALKICNPKTILYLKIKYLREDNSSRFIKSLTNEESKQLKFIYEKIQKLKAFA